MTYVSDRNIPLLCQTRHQVPVITMENYCKWYGVYILQPDGKVEPVDPDVMYTLGNDLPGHWFGDHCYHPAILHALAKHYGGEVCDRSFEVVTGRWVIETMDGTIKGQMNAHYGADGWGAASREIDNG